MGVLMKEVRARRQAGVSIDLVRLGEHSTCLQLGDARRRRVPDVVELAEARRGEDRACDLPRGAARLGARPWASVDAVTPGEGEGEGEGEG